MIEFGHGTHRGLRRPCNEDTYFADPASGLFLVVDGMGGDGRGFHAASMVRECVLEALHRGLPLAEAMQCARRCLARPRPDANQSLPLGATLALLRLGPSSFEAAWVGDSRIYHQATSIHTLAPLPPTPPPAGKPDATEEAPVAPAPAPHTLTQALGITPPAKLVIHVSNGPLGDGSTFLLCTDGLVEDVPPQQLARTMARRDIGAQEAVDHLLLAALDAGGRDNATALVIRCRRR